MIANQLGNDPLAETDVWLLIRNHRVSICKMPVWTCHSRSQPLSAYCKLVLYLLYMPRNTDKILLPAAYIFFHFYFVTEFIISPIFLEFSPHSHALRCVLPFPVTNKKQEKGEKNFYKGYSSTEPYIKFCNWNSAGQDCIWMRYLSSWALALSFI